jgi:hypothetical protein
LESIKGKMVRALETLPFSTDMFVIDTHQDKIAHQNVVAFILREVRLNDNEVQVCRAVAEWARIVQHETIRDSYTDMEPGAEAPEGASAGIASLGSLTEVEFVKNNLDLAFVSTQDLYEVRPAGPAPARALSLTAKPQHKAQGASNFPYVRLGIPRFENTEEEKVAKLRERLCWKVRSMHHDACKHVEQYA